MTISPAVAPMPQPRRRKPREDGPTALYELYSADKTLLYVGISHRPRYRLREHAKSKPWWPEVAHRSLIWFDTRAEALICEQVVIESLGPRHNQTISPQDIPPPPGVLRGPLYPLILAYKDAHRTLMAGIREHIKRGEPNARIARSVDWSREYIARIRNETDPTKAKKPKEDPK